MSWFHQIENYELGNFIMATPMLKAVSEMRGKPIPVYFDNKHVKSLYVNCPFITIKNKKPKTNPFETSEKPRSRKKGETNYECYFRLHAQSKGYNKEMPHPYVDVKQNIKLKSNKKCIALFHGCLATKSSRVKLKRLNIPVLNHMIKGIKKQNLQPVVIGSAKDKARFWSKTILDKEKDVINYVGELSLIDSVGVLSQCDAFISNDTGLYHVAGALKIPGLVFWIKTDRIANRSPAKNIVHMHDGSGNIRKFKTAINLFGKGKIEK